MPYADPDKQREYIRKWKAARRAAFMKDKCCKMCGSTESLEIDHIDPLSKTHKVASSAMWTWSDRRLREELVKCQVLCKSCHKQKFRADLLIRREAWKKRKQLQESILNG